MRIMLAVTGVWMALLPVLAWVARADEGLRMAVTVEQGAYVVQPLTDSHIRRPLPAVNRSDDRFVRWCQDWISFSQPQQLTFIHWQTGARRDIPLASTNLHTISGDGRLIIMGGRIIDVCNPAVSDPLPLHLRTRTMHGSFHDENYIYVATDTTDLEQPDAIVHAAIAGHALVYRSERRLQFAGHTPDYLIFTEGPPVGSGIERVLRYHPPTRTMTVMYARPMIEVLVGAGATVIYTADGGRFQLWWQPVDAPAPRLVWEGAHEVDSAHLRLLPDAQLVWLDAGDGSAVPGATARRLDVRTGAVNTLADDVRLITDTVVPHVAALLDRHSTRTANGGGWDFLTTDGRLVHVAGGSLLPGLRIDGGDGWDLLVILDSGQLHLKRGIAPTEPLSHTLRYARSPDGQTIAYTPIPAGNTIALYTPFTASRAVQVTLPTPEGQYWPTVYAERWTDTGLVISQEALGSRTSRFNRYALQGDGRGLRMMIGAADQWHATTQVDDPAVSNGRYAWGVNVAAALATTLTGLALLAWTLAVGAHERGR